MRKSQISASMMCSNLVDLQATIDVFEKEKVEYLHIDVMDGEFVPNFGLGVDYIRGLRELTSIPLDLHLMIKVQAAVDRHSQRGHRDDSL